MESFLRNDKTMNRDAICIATATLLPKLCRRKQKSGARIVGSGRSDYPNQINNVLVFSGLFKGAGEQNQKNYGRNENGSGCRIGKVNFGGRIERRLYYSRAFDPRVAETVAKEVEKVAKEQGICRE